jgi:hypothetical protein
MKEIEQTYNAYDSSGKLLFQLQATICSDQIDFQSESDSETTEELTYFSSSCYPMLIAYRSISDDNVNACEHDLKTYLDAIEDRLRLEKRNAVLLEKIEIETIDLLLKKWADEILTSQKFSPCYLPDFILDKLGRTINEDVLEQVNLKYSALDENGVVLHLIDSRLMENSMYRFDNSMHEDDQWLFHLLQLAAPESFKNVEKSKLFEQIQDTDLYDFIFDNPEFTYSELQETYDSDLRAYIAIHNEEHKVIGFFKRPI